MALPPLTPSQRTSSIKCPDETAVRLLIGAMLVSALLLGGVPSARAMAPKPEPEDIANAAALMAAPWLACSLGPDSAAGLPDGMKWNWEKSAVRSK